MFRYEEFNGPCIVCLEPDEESRNRIIELRELLLEEPELSRFASYGPTLTLSDEFPFSTSTHTMDFRPMIPIASFPSVTSAVEMARKLRTLWDPLSISVTDLHIVSNGGSPSLAVEDESDDDDVYAIDYFVHSMWSQPTDSEQVKQIGCDALIMLEGEELKMDKTYNEAMANIIAQKGYIGGYGTLKNTTETEFEAENSNSDDDVVHKWLDSFDEEEDEGTVIVIGRTHFFTGEMRMYMGMPAVSSGDEHGRTFGIVGQELGGFGRKPARSRRRTDRRKKKVGEDDSMK